MSRRLRWLSSREVCALLGRLGFQVVTTRGSDAKLRRATPDGRHQTLTIALHRELAPGTLRAIFRQACRFVPEEDLGTLFFGEGSGSTLQPGRFPSQDDSLARTFSRTGGLDGQ